MPKRIVSVTFVLMPHYLTTREVAGLLRIKERKVYDLAASGALTCSKAMGKLLFPEDAVHAWLFEHGAASGQHGAGPRPNVLLGSHDPLLDWALRNSRCGLATYFDGSTDGLERFAKGEGIASGLHIFEPAAGSWNVDSVAQACSGAPVVLVQWAIRQRGLILGVAVPGKVAEIKDVAGMRLAPRQTKAGAQKLFEHLLAEASLDAGAFVQTETVRTETDAALAVQEGKADVTFGLASVAASYRLRFVPLLEERFDLLVDRKAWFDAPWQTFWDFCQTDRFCDRAKELTGYDVSGLGTVHFNGP